MYAKLGYMCYCTPELRAALTGSRFRWQTWSMHLFVSNQSDDTRQVKIIVCDTGYEVCVCVSIDDSRYTSISGKFTREEVLGSQVADTQAQDGEFVQSGGDLFGEGQQAGQTLQLPVQPVSVPFGRVGLRPFSRRLLHPNKHETGRKCQVTHRFQLLSSSFSGCGNRFCQSDVMTLNLDTVFIMKTLSLLDQFFSGTEYFVYTKNYWTAFLFLF